MRKIKTLLLFIILAGITLACSNSDDDAHQLSGFGTVLPNSIVLLDADTIKVRPQSNMLNGFTEGDRLVMYFTSDRLINDSLNSNEVYDVVADRVIPIETYREFQEAADTIDIKSFPFAKMNRQWLSFDYLNIDFNYYVVDSIDNFDVIRRIKTTANSNTAIYDTVVFELVHLPQSIDSTNTVNKKVVSLKLDNKTLNPANRDTVILAVKMLTLNSITDTIANQSINYHFYKRQQ